MEKSLKTQLLATVIIAVLAFTMFFAGYVLATLTANKEISNSASVITTINLSVYDTQGGTVELTFVDWGNILPLQVKTKEIFVQNDAAISMVITISTKNWVPVYASETISFTYVEGPSYGWDTGNFPKLLPGYRGSILLSLSAGESPPSGPFSFVIVISGSSS